MTPDDQTRLARAALRTDVLRFAVGSTPEQVDALFDEIVSAWGMRADQLPVAVDILAHAAQLSRGAVIMWLHQTFLLMQTAAGRQIAMQLGARAAEIERGIAESATKH